MRLRLFLSAMLAATLTGNCFVFQLMSQAQPDEFQPASVDDCRLALRAPSDIVWRGPFSRGYEADHSGSHLEPFSVDIRNDGGACGFLIEIAPASGAFELKHAGAVLAFGIRSNEAARASGSSPALEIENPYPMSGGSRSVNFLIDVEPGQRVNAGRYSQDLEIKLYKTTETETALADTRRFTVVAEVWPAVSASIGSTAKGGRATTEINLGAIRAGTQASMDFSVYSNTPYQISIASEHKGSLKHFRSDAFLPYDLILDGRLLESSELRGDTVVSSGNTSRTHDFDLRINDISGIPAGYYADRVTVTITGD